MLKEVLSVAAAARRIGQIAMGGARVPTVSSALLARGYINFNVVRLAVSASLTVGVRRERCLSRLAPRERRVKTFAPSCVDRILISSGRA